MPNALILVSALGLLLGAEARDVQPTSQIVGGQPATIEKFPYQVRAKSADIRGSRRKENC